MQFFWRFNRLTYKFYSSLKRSQHLFKLSSIKPYTMSALFRNSSGTMKILAVFDFDHTIVDDNSDTAVFALSKEGVPQKLKSVQYSDGWTAFMQGVFTHLFQQNVNIKEIEDLIRTLPPVPGMVELIKELANLENDLIIISDSNSLFIKVWLEENQLDKCFLKTFTNPAEVKDGMLKITPYHDQETCKLSTRNLCKGQILEDFVDAQMDAGVVYDKVVYIGDGTNDFCPVLKLSLVDLACARKDHKLIELIEKAKKGLSLDSSKEPHIVKADVLVWETGNDILKYIKDS